MESFIKLFHVACNPDRDSGHRFGVRTCYRGEGAPPKPCYDSSRNLAKEIVRSRQAIKCLYENRAQLNSISTHLGESGALKDISGSSLYCFISDTLPWPTMFCHWAIQLSALRNISGRFLYCFISDTLPLPTVFSHWAIQLSALKDIFWTFSVFLRLRCKLICSCCSTFSVEGHFWTFYVLLQLRYFALAYSVLSLGNPTFSIEGHFWAFSVLLYLRRPHGLRNNIPAQLHVDWQAKKLHLQPCIDLQWCSICRYSPCIFH